MFKDNDAITVFTLLEGVRFSEKILADGSTVEMPSLSFKVGVKMLRGKKEEPLFVGESREINVSTVNNYIEEIKDYRRLSSFGIAFPFHLLSGRYEITLMITDNQSHKTIQQELDWLVVPADIATP